MKKVSHFIVAFSAIAVVACCQPLQAQKATAKQSPAPVKVTSAEGITEYRLTNGLRVLLFPDPSKDQATVNITYMVGSRMEGYGETGMAHLLEHMAFKGSTHHPNVPQELTAHGARPNGTTWYDRTNYFESFTATDENLRWALSLESDRMVNSFIAKKDLETEFSVVRNEFESGENDPGSVLQERVMSTAYLWHNYGKSTIGSKEDIERVPIDNLKAFYKKYYQPDNAVLTVAGKFDEQKTLALINEYFGTIPKPTRVMQEPYTAEPTQDGERFVELKRVGDVQVVACGYHIPGGAHPDYPPIAVLMQALTNEPSGRLYKAMVASKKASSVYGFAYSLKDPGFAYFSAEVLKEKSLDEAKHALFNKLDSLPQSPVAEDEVTRAKNQILKDFELTYNNSGNVGLTLSEYIAKGDWRLWFLYRDQVEKVTAADVNRVAKAYFKPSNRTVGLFIPDAKPDRAEIPATPDIAGMLKDYKGKQALALAEAFDPSPANIDRRTKTGTISGGAKYAFLSKSTRGGLVSASITLRIGSESSLKNMGTVARLTGSMLDKGSKNKTRQQLTDELDKLKASVSVYGNGQAVGIDIQTTKENLLQALGIVTEMLRQPVFPQEEFDKLVQEELTGIEQQKSEPQSIASLTFSRITNPYPKDDFRYPMEFEEQTAAVKSTSLNAVKKFYADFYNSANATVAVVGDFDENAVKTSLTDILQNWTSPVAYQRAPGQFFDVNARSEKINTPDKANAMMMAGFNLSIRDDDPDYPALVMGNYMLGGGFLNSRLATRIRQKEGISYGVASWLSAGPIDKIGSFGSYAIYNPDNSDKLIKAYKEEIERMRKEGFTAEELKDARSGYLQSRNVSRSEDRSLTYKLSNNLFLNRTMQWDEAFEKRIGSLSAGDINAAVQRWIKPEKIIYTQAGDFERKKANN